MFNDLLICWLRWWAVHSHNMDLAFSLLHGNPTDPAARELSLFDW